MNFIVILSGIAFLVGHVVSDVQFTWRTPNPYDAIEIDPDLSLAQFTYKLTPYPPLNYTYFSGKRFH